MKPILTAITLALALGSIDAAPPKAITEQDALQIAKKQLVSARPDLNVKDPVPSNRFVAAGPGSGGGPKWVVGFDATDRNSHKKGVYYVTVFPDGRTSEKEIRQGPDMGPVAGSNPAK